MRLSLLFGLLILTQVLFAQSFTEVPPALPFDGVIGSIAFSDVNNDGSDDVLIVGTTNSLEFIAKLYTNDGTGNFTEMTGTPFEGVFSGSTAFADVNGDGSVDVLITGRNFDSMPIATLYINDGTGNFIEMTGTPFDGVGSSSIAFSDVNGDGNADVLITGRNSSNQRIAKLYTNDGLGNFTEVTGTPFDGVDVGSIAFSDVNGDTNADILITGRNSASELISKLYTNDGLGNFTEMTDTSLEGVAAGSIAFSDVNGDGSEDVLLTGFNNSFEETATLYTNNGAGNFTEISGTPFEGVIGSSIAFSDVNGDGNADVLITGENSSDQRIAKLYTNDGTGNFTEVTGTPFEGVSSSSIAFSDVNNDGSDDILITGTTDSSEEIAKLYTNDGTGNFTEVLGTPFDRVVFSSIAFSDVNNDGSDDVLIAGENSSDQRIAKLYTNNGMGNFTERLATPFDGVRSGSITFADVNGDGNSDVLITGLNNSDQRIAKLYTNDGTGNFTERPGTPFDGVTLSSIAFADVNNDGNVDVLITGDSGGATLAIAKLYTNDGTGNFTEMTGTPFEAVTQSSVAFADVNDDGNVDVLITGTNLAEVPIAKLYLNIVNGTFSEMTGTPFDGVRFGSSVFSDVDNDGDPDVLITGINGSFEGITKMYRNDGMGNFTEILGTPFDGVFTSSIAFSDIDSDGDEDVLITGANTLSSRIAKLYTNDGIGNFTEITNTSFDGVQSGSIAFSDIDSDGDEDVLITGANTPSSRIAKLYTNDGMFSSTNDFSEALKLDLKPHPNPATSTLLNVSFNSINQGFALVRVYDLNGRLLSQKREFLTMGQQIISIDITSLSSGMYLVQIDTGNIKGVTKFVVE